MAIQGKEILIVDDAADSRLIARKILSNVEAICTEAKSVNDALESLQTKSPHLILLDLHLLGASGFDFLAQRAIDPRLSAVPVIVVSAAADKDTIYRAIALGANDYAIKPVTASLLIRKVRKALKDLDFKTYKIPANHAEKAVVHFSAQVSRPGETDFYLESSLKIAAETQVRLSSNLLDQAGLQSCVYVATGLPNVRGASGEYYTKVKIMGLTKALSRLFKKERSA